MSALPPLEKFLRTPMLVAATSGAARGALEARAPGGTFCGRHFADKN